MDPCAGRNGSGMIRTPRVRAPRVVAVRYTPPWPRASQSRGWGAERITHTCEYCTRNDPDEATTRTRISSHLRGRNRRPDRFIRISYLERAHRDGHKK